MFYNSSKIYKFNIWLYICVYYSTNFEFKFIIFLYVCLPAITINVYRSDRANTKQHICIDYRICGKLDQKTYTKRPHMSDM